MKPGPYIKQKIIRCGDKIAVQNNAFYSFQISRSLIAFGTLCTLLFSPANSLFTHTIFKLAESNNTMPANINLFTAFGYEHIYISRLISIIILLLVISGYFHKIASLLHWYVSFSLYSSLTIVDGGDQIASIITLLFIPISFFDKRKNTWHKKEVQKENCHYSTFLSNSFLFIIKLQIAIIYLNAGVSKLSVPDWQNGSAYYYWFNHNAFGAPTYLKYILGSFFSNPFAVTAVSWGTIILEIALFGCLFSSHRGFKKLMFTTGVLFHALIFVIHGLFSFCFIMLGCLYIYLKSDNQKPQFTFSPAL
jgi:antimicrobial peptide system SdpB family protein